jgi:hypothetical protein
MRSPAGQWDPECAWCVVTPGMHGALDALIPHMLETFMARDREFNRAGRLGAPEVDWASTLALCKHLNL